MIEHLDVNLMRNFFGSAIKFLIPKESWDDQHPTSEFDSEPSVAAFHTGFDTFSAAEMTGAAKLPQEDSNLLTLVRTAANPGRRWSKRVAKRKSTRLRKEMKKRFLLYIHTTEEPMRGLRYYERLIREKYFYA